MNWLLELLFEGVQEIFAQFIIDMMELITSMFTELLSCDLSLFEELFSVVDELYLMVMIPLGIAMLLLICVWQLLKSMFGRTGESSEEPMDLILRSCVCLFFIVAARPVINYVLAFAGTPYQWVVGTEIKVESFSDYVNALEAATTALGIDGLSIQILKLIMQFVMAWNYFKMLFLIAERYVLLGVFSYTAPLAFAAGGSKSTNSILGSWSKMFGGQIILIILDAWFMKMFLSAYGNLLASNYGFTKFFVATLCLIGFCKIMLKLDTYMASLGLNLGRPSGGGGVLGMMMAAGRLLSSFAGSEGSSMADGETAASGQAKNGAEYTSQGMTEGLGNPIPLSAETDDLENGNMKQDAFGVEGESNVLNAPESTETKTNAFDNDNVLDELGMSSVVQNDGQLNVNGKEESEQPSNTAGINELSDREGAGSFGTENPEISNAKGEELTEALAHENVKNQVVLDHSQDSLAHGPSDSLGRGDGTAFGGQNEASKLSAGGVEERAAENVNAMHNTTQEGFEKGISSSLSPAKAAELQPTFDGALEEMEAQISRPSFGNAMSDSVNGENSEALRSFARGENQNESVSERRSVLDGQEDTERIQDFHSNYGKGAWEGEASSVMSLGGIPEVPQSREDFSKRGVNH